MSAQAFALTAREMADAFGGVLGYGAEDRLLPTVSIDTRTLVPGDLYVAIRGPRFDGHAFVAQAIARGAAGVVVSDPAAVTATDLPVIVVEDTLHGLQEAARVIRRRAAVDRGGHHRQRRQDHDEGDHGDAARSPVHDLPQSRQPEQSHRPAALALRVAHRAAVRRHGTRHERRRRDQPTRVDCRTASARLDQRRRGTPRLLRVDRRDRDGQAGDPRRRGQRRRLRRQRR